MSNEKRDFDKDAASWDEEPRRLKLVNDVASSIIKEIKLTSDMDVLDFGSGTGLLTLKLNHLVNSVTGADTSKGMLDVLKTKIEKQSIHNVKTQYLDNDTVLNDKYHLVVSNMTFHHIKDISPVIKQFFNILYPSGYLCISDLDSDDGKFHDNNTGVFHFGFDRKKLFTLLNEAGFKEIRDITASEVLKPNAEGVIKKFTVFLMICRKIS